jgi:hypothetical protein
MKPINLDDIRVFVEKNIGGFHKRRAESLRYLKLSQVLQRKNPYLFKAKNILTAQDLIKLLLDAHLSSQEETLFAEFLKNLAIFVCGQTFAGKKSNSEGIDLEFERDGVIYIVVIKSGPNWGNSGQINRMQENFIKAKKILQSSKKDANVQAINGCCYGRDNQPDKGEYRKLCGQEFWELISGDDRLFIDVIDSLGYRAKQRNDEFGIEYGRILNIFTSDFYREFCADGVIDWERLVRFNSEKKS